MKYEERYLELVRQIMFSGIDDHNLRTSHFTRRIVGTMVCCDLRREWPLLSVRKMYPKTGAAELAWMLMGTQNGYWLKKHSKIWEKFEENGMLKAAYGYRWRYHFDRDQIQECIELLKKDPSSRQAVVFAWDPALDGLAEAGKAKNIPCHMGFSAYVIGNRLDLCVYQRSVDVIVGLPYDILLYGLLNMAMAKSLGVSVGKVSIAFGDTHIYDSHFEIAEELINIGEKIIVHQNHALEFNSPTVDEIVKNPDEYVSNVVDNFSNFMYSGYAPKPEVIL